jgi:hypothetical protein
VTGSTANVTVDSDTYPVSCPTSVNLPTRDGSGYWNLAIAGNTLKTRRATDNCPPLDDLAWVNSIVDGYSPVPFAAFCLEASPSIYFPQVPLLVSGLMELDYTNTSTSLDVTTSPTYTVVTRFVLDRYNPPGILTVEFMDNSSSVSWLMPSGLYFNVGAGVSRYSINLSRPRVPGSNLFNLTSQFWSAYRQSWNKPLPLQYSLVSLVGAGVAKLPVHVTFGVA